MILENYREISTECKLVIKCFSTSAIMASEICQLCICLTLVFIQSEFCYQIINS